MTRRAKNGGDERRQRTGSLVQHLLKERKQLLSLMMGMADGEHRDGAGTDAKRLREFCQILVDYVAAGHFGLFERIVNGTERRRNVALIAAELLPGIQQSTESAVTFNEKYAPDRGDPDLSRLAQDLSAMGEELTTRFEFEDRLIAELAASRQAPA